VKFKRLSLKNKNNMRLLFYILLLTFISISSVHAATYNYYFSNAGSGSTCSQASPCANLYDAKTKISAVSSGDTVNLYFNRGDTWSVDTTAKKACHGLFIGPNDPIVNIDAYGSGNRPIFDGLVSDFSTADAHNASTGPLFYSRFFEFQRNSCSVKNVEMKRIYGHAIFLSPSDYFTLDSSYIHHFGAGGISTALKTGGSNIKVINNTFYTGQELWRYSLRSGWEAAIQLISNDELCDNNTIQYNVVYDIYGEGIQCPNSLCEYNVVGNTASVAINAATHNWESRTTTVRYNFVIMEDWDEHGYDTMHEGASGPVGIRVFDEKVGGDNSAADISIYGNIVINRSMGIWAYNTRDYTNPYGSVKIYNNTVIDSHYSNIYVAEANGFNSVKIYNNTSVLYDQIEANHVFDQEDFLPHDNWTIDNNHYWTTGGSPTVDVDWQTNYVTADPKLNGEPAVDWDGQSGGNYISAIDFSTHLSLAADSGLINAGKILGPGYGNIFLTTGTDFNASPDKITIQKISQPVESNWTIGAIVCGGGTPISPPVGLSIQSLD